METIENASTNSSTVDRALIETWLHTSEEGKKLTSEESEYFLAVAITHNLNPFKRELYARIQYENGERKYSLVTGFEVYLKRAAETGKLDGYSTRIEGDGEDLKAVAEIYRKDWSHPFIGEAYFIEVAQKNDQGILTPFWNRSKRYMLRKVCLSQSFRLAFPEILAGLPYEASELPYSEKNSSENQSQGKSTDAKAKTANENKERTKEISLQELISEIRALVIDNRSILSDDHASWIMSQLNQPKTQPQLAGLLKHVRNAIAEAKTTLQGKQSPQQSSVRRFPGVGRSPSTDSTKTTKPMAAGAEGVTF
jgi:hypothetical protein